MAVAGKRMKKKKKKKKGVGVGVGTGGAEDERRTSETTATKKKNEAAAAVDVVVLRMELHCDGCALKVRKAIKGVQGAESVRTDVAAGTVTVAGNGNGKAAADPWDLRDRIQARLPAVDIAFVSPANPPRPPPPKPKEEQRRRWWINKNKNKGDGDANNNKCRCHDKHMQMPPPPESTVVLNIHLHCKGCTDRIKRKANKIKGVKQVTVDTAKEQVTVKGTMDAKALPDVLSAKLKRPVTAVVVPPITNKEKKAAAAAAAADGGGDNNHDHNKEQLGDEEATRGGTAGGANRKKNKNCKQHQQRGEDAAVAGDGEMASWMSEEHPMTIFPASYGRGGSVGSSYRVHLLQGPQLFSEENPNACSLM